MRSIIIEPLLVALSFLTRLPLNLGETSPSILQRSLAFFPLVGFLLGTVLCAAAWFFHKMPAPTLWASLLVAILALTTGALHLDGVADFFDALGGGRGRRERMLEIMRDPRIGAHGATALCLLLIAKVQAFSYGLSHFDPVMWLLLPATSRFAVVPLVAFFPVARPDGLAKTFHGPNAAASVAFAALSLIAVVVFTSINFIAPLLTALFVALLVGSWSKRSLGGLTGDVYGVSIELSELAFIAVWIAIPQLTFI